MTRAPARSDEPARRAQLAAVETPVASVVLCTRNRAESLSRTLRSLEDERSRIPAEIIVIDNGSSDETAAVVAAAAETSSRPVRLVHEPAVGLARARNTGVRAARGEFVLFLDDDVVVHERWIDELVEGFDAGVAMVAGRIFPRYTFEPPAWLAGGGATALSLFDYGDVAFEMGERALPLGANMAIRADPLRAFREPFHPELGHTGEISLGHEEHYLARRLSGRIRYVPSAAVDHLVDASRADFGRARRIYFQLGFGRARYERFLGARDRRLPDRIARMAWIILKVAAIRADNSRRSEVTSAQGRRELTAYYAAGHHLDQLFAGVPGLADWCARALL